MDRPELYAKMAARKDKPKDYEPYDGGNGRVNKCESLMRQGKIRTGGTLLDVGGGIGDLGYAVRDLFERRIVLDISSTSLQAARKKGNWVVQADVDRHGFHVDDPAFPPEGWSDVDMMSRTILRSNRSRTA